MEHKNDIDTRCNRETRYSHQNINNGTTGFGNWWTYEDYPNYIMIEISENTEKSPGNLKRLAVTKIRVEDYQLKLAWKTFKEVN